MIRVTDEAGMETCVLDLGTMARVHVDSATARVYLENTGREDAFVNVYALWETFDPRLKEWGPPLTRRATVRNGNDVHVTGDPILIAIDAGPRNFYRSSLDVSIAPGQRLPLLFKLRPVEAGELAPFRIAIRDGLIP